MCWGSISTKGDLAKALATTLGKSIGELDKLDGEKDGKISLWDLSQKMPDRVLNPSEGCMYRNASTGVIVVDNGDKQIGENDMVIIQSWDRDFAFGGGAFQKLLDGYERESGAVVAAKDSVVAANMRVWGRNIINMVRHEKITVFSDFKKHADRIIKLAVGDSTK